MAVTKKWASSISVVASSLFAFIIVFQIPLFRVACRNKTCESPLEVISSQLIGSELVPSSLVKTLLYPGAIVKSLLRGSPLPTYHNLFYFYHFDQLHRASSTDDIRHLEVFAGCCLCLLGALLSIFKPRRLTFIGTLLIYWGLLRDILVFDSSSVVRVYPTLFLASLSAFLSIRATSGRSSIVVVLPLLSPFPNLSDLITRPHMSKKRD